MPEEFDFIVIGGGSAGYAAARTARERSDRVAIVDGADELGGLCILRGCMPSKTLIYSAEVLHLARQGKLFGLEIPEARADMPAVLRRKRAMVDDFKSYRQEQLHSERFTLYCDYASFVDPHTIELRSSHKRLRSKNFLIATGSTVNFPPVPGLDSVDAWTSDEVLDLDFLPESVIVLGGGVVACEMAQLLRRYGSKVIQIQRSPHILKETSDKAAETIAEVFRSEGIELYTGTHLQEVARDENGGVRVSFTQGKESHTVHAAHLLNALGRRPAIAGLALDKAGVQSHASEHVDTNEFQQTSVPHIYAAGDVAGPVEIVHIAILQGEVAARHAFGETPEKVNYDELTQVVFTDPQVAQVGISPEEARERGMNVVEADYPFDDHGKSILMEARHGYVKVWACADSCRVLGAECVGKDGGELMHVMAVAVSMKAKVADLLKVQWYHPTLSEIWSYPLEDLQEAMNEACEPKSAEKLPVTE